MKRLILLSAVLCASLLLLPACDSSDPAPGDDDCGEFDYCIEPPPPNDVDTEPDWGPDGRIAYRHFSQHGEPSGLWLLDPETGERRFLTQGKFPSWSPDGEHIAFMGGRSIYTVEVETGAVELVIACAWCASPDWSPDGERIAFKRVFDDPGFPSGLWLINPDGSGQRQILAHRNDPGDPDWAPGGGRIVARGYFNTEGLSGELIVTDTLGHENEERLTHNDLGDGEPAWSPDDQWIVWYANGEGGCGDDPSAGLYRMRPDGTDAEQLTDCGGFPAWSPDGEEIVYLTFFDEDAYDDVTKSLWIMNSDGSNQRPLTRPEDYQQYADDG